MLVHELKLQIKAFGVAKIISIDPRDQRGAGFGHKLIETGNMPAIFPRNDADPAILPSVFAGNCLCRVCRSIVENDELEITHGLGQYALDGTRNVILAIEDT